MKEDKESQRIAGEREEHLRPGCPIFWLPWVTVEEEVSRAPCKDTHTNDSC